jgi:hypothetical protein
LNKKNHGLLAHPKIFRDTAVCFYLFIVWCEILKVCFEFQRGDEHGETDRYENYYKDHEPWSFFNDSSELVQHVL